MDFVASPTSEASDHTNDDRLTHAATEPVSGLVPSHNISLNQNPESAESKPPLLKTMYVELKQPILLILTERSI